MSTPHYEVPKMESIELSNIDDLINYWRAECDDINPSNVDSLDRPAVETIDDLLARKAIYLVPALLEELKSHMVREKEGRETELSTIAHAESKKWLKRLAKWLR